MQTGLILNISALDSIILFGSLAVVSMLLVAILNARDGKRKLLKNKLRAMKRRAHQIENLLYQLQQLVEDRSVAIEINELLLDLARSMKDMAPKDSQVEMIYQTALDRADVLLDDSTFLPLNRIKESDVNVARAKKHLKDSTELLRIRMKENQLDKEKMNTLYAHLSWAHLMIDAMSFIGQGHKACQANKRLVAESYYRKAKSILLDSSHDDTRKRRFASEIEDLATGKRTHISIDLMPESHLNPILELQSA